MSLEQKMDLMFEELKGARSQISQLGEQMDGLETRMGQFDTRLDHMEGRIKGLDENIVELDERLTCRIDKLDERMDGLEQRMDDLEGKVDHLGESVDEMNAKQELFGNVLERLASKVSLLHGQERANRVFIEFQLERKFAILDQDLSAVMDMILWLKNKTMDSKAA